MPPIDPTSSVTADQLTRALGEAVIRIWSNLPQDGKIICFRRRSRLKASPYHRTLRSPCTTSIHAPRTHWATRAK